MVYANDKRLKLPSMKKIVKLIYAEAIKLKRTPALIISIIGASLIQCLFFCMRFFKPEYFLPKEGVNPWIDFINSSFMQSSFLLLPMFIILITALILFTEHKANAWKQVLIMPNSRFQLFCAKYTIIVVLVLGTFILFGFLLLLNGFVLGWLRPELNFLNYKPDYLLLLKSGTKLFLMSISIISIQFWLSIHIKNIAIPLGIGMAMVIAGLILSSWEHIIYFPYTHHFLSAYEIAGTRQIPHMGNLSYAEISGFTIAVLAFLGNYIHFKYKQIIN